MNTFILFVLAQTPELPPIGDGSTDELLRAAQLAFEAIAAGNWWMAVGPAIVFLLAVVRFLAGLAFVAERFPRFAHFMQHPRVKRILPAIVTAAGGFAHALLIGASPAVAAAGVGKVLVSTLLAQLAEYLAEKRIGRARAAGAAAAAGVDSEEKALEAFRGKGPGP